MPTHLSAFRTSNYTLTPKKYRYIMPHHWSFPTSRPSPLLSPPKRTESKVKSSHTGVAATCSFAPVEPLSGAYNTCCNISNHPAHHYANSSKTTRMRRGLTTVGQATLGIHPNEIDARSLRAGGATALLCANVDQNTIQLLGRWKSDAMIRYLHISANPQVHQHAHQMFTHGQASFSPPSSQQPEM